MSQLFPTLRASDADKGGRGDLIQVIRGNKMSKHGDQRTSTFSAVSADSRSQQNGRDSARSGSARSTNTARKSSPKTFCPTPSVPNGGRTLKPVDIMRKGATEKGKRQVGLEKVVKLFQT